MTFRDPAIEEIFRQASERVSIADLSGVQLGQVGPCPICCPGEKKRKVFSNHRKTGRWKCFRGCGGGDVVKLQAQLSGLTLIEAARWLINLPIDGSGDGVVAPETDTRREQRERDARRREEKQARSAQLSRDYHGRVIAELDADQAWAPATGSLRVQRWLSEARGIPLGMLPDVLHRLRSVPRAPYEQNFERGDPDFGRITRHPAMVAIIVNAAGERIGRHATYLTLSGDNKADVDAPRKIWGQARGGVWLTGPEPELGPLFVAEGIETTLSMLVAHRIATGKRTGRALALLSLNNLQGGIRLDKFGRIDLARTNPDPDKPAVTFPHMGRVVIGVDHDMSEIAAKVRKPEGGTEQVMLSGTQRMEICARLASYWWGMAGAEVSVARPKPGLDFNDQWRGEREEGRELAHGR